jgi:uncharacterized protein (TIGR00730 family)
MQRIAVLCGSALGARPEYAAAARAFAQVLLRRGLGVVYGGSPHGLMQVVAETMLAGGGEVIGVPLTSMRDRDVVAPGLTATHVVATLAERKALFAELADAFIALPGGYGTLDELFEMVTWTQMGFQAKPCGVLNVAGYFAPLLALCDHAVAEGFVKEHHRNIILADDDPNALLDQCLAFTPPAVSAWNRPLGQ